MSTNDDKTGFLQRLAEQVLIGDGAMGSRLYEICTAQGIELPASFDSLNLTHSDLVRRVHQEYFDAGAQLLEANSFSANRLKLAAAGLEAQVAQINRRAVELAREVSVSRAFVAGAVGPLPARGGAVSVDDLSDDEQRLIFREQIAALADAGADLLMLETFTDLHQIQLALSAARDVVGNRLPIVAQMTFPDGRHAPDGSDAVEALRSLRAAGADVVGANCGRGVAKVLRTIEHLGRHLDEQTRLSAFPNAGMPEQVDGRSLYLMTPEYFADAVEQMARAGANLIGGCCGTRPADIAAAVQRIGRMKPVARRAGGADDEAAAGTTVAGATPPAALPEFLARVRPANAAAQRQRTVVLVELDPPRGTDVQQMLRAVRSIKEAGADAITLGDSPLATLRMDSMISGAIIERELDIPVICHLACRDRNLIGVQSLLLGAHALGIRSVLAITGDPSKLGDHPEAASVYDLNSFKLIELITRRLNCGQNDSGQSIGRATAFHVGAAFNANANNLDVEIKRLRKKVQAGATFALTQPVFDADTMSRACAAARDLGIPIFAGVYPLFSSRNAEFLHNEFPGIKISDTVRKRMADAGPDKPRMASEGIAIARELIDAFRESADGLYLIAPLNRPKVPVLLLEHIRQNER